MGLRTRSQAIPDAEPTSMRGQTKPKRKLLPSSFPYRLPGRLFPVEAEARGNRGTPEGNLAKARPRRQLFRQDVRVAHWKQEGWTPLRCGHLPALGVTHLRPSRPLRLGGTPGGHCSTEGRGPPWPRLPPSGLAP